MRTRDYGLLNVVGHERAFDEPRCYSAAGVAVVNLKRKQAGQLHGLTHRELNTFVRRLLCDGIDVLLDHVDTVTPRAAELREYASSCLRPALARRRDRTRRRARPPAAHVRTPGSVEKSAEMNRVQFPHCCRRPAKCMLSHLSPAH